MSQVTLEELTGLLSGERRIAVSDLVDTGFLEPGTEIEWRRRDVTHSAVVGADGSITTRANPEAGVAEAVYQSPSAAGTTIAGRPINGWDVWKVADGDNAGQTLGQRRDNFLEALEKVIETKAFERAAIGNGGERDADTSQTHESATNFLSEAAERARSGAPRRVSVRELLSYWGARNRGMRVVEQIENGLVNHGLTTNPRFTDVALDSTVTLVAVAPSVSDDGDAASPAVVEDAPSADGTNASTPTADAGVTVSVSFPERETSDTIHAVTLGNVAGGELATISGRAPLDAAITQMQLDDYSQLGVTGEQQRLIGAVTWKSICRAAHLSRKSLSELKVHEAIVPVARHPYTRKLKDMIGDITRDGFVVVEVPGARDKIVTVSDVADSYREMAAPFFLVGELDQRLRRAVGRTDRKTWPSDIDRDEPSFGDYIKILSSSDHWQALAWPLQKKPFIDKLETIRDMRNDLMHFNSPDPAPPETISSLENLLHIVEYYEAAHVD